MVNLSRIMFPLVALTLMAACTSNPRVQSNNDGDLDFGQYSTFDFGSRTEIKDPDMAGNLELYFSAAVMQELHAKGLAKSDDPDILINVSVDLEDVSRPPSRRGSCPRYEDYSSRKIYPEYGGFTGVSRRPMCVYTEGLITVELIDAKGNQSIMEGSSRVRLGENDRGDALLQSVVDDVATMFGRTSVNDRSVANRHVRHHNN